MVHILRFGAKASTGREGLRLYDFGFSVSNFGFDSWFTVYGYHLGRK